MQFLSKAPVTILRRRALLRLDFNTADEWRLEATLPTIKLLQKRATSIVIVSHRGRPDDLRLKNGHPIKTPEKFSLRRDSQFLSKALKTKIYFIPHFNFSEIREQISNSKKGSIFIIENLRFLEGEEFNDPKLGKDLASLADYYVNDAFAVSHREASSVVAVTKHLPSYAGLELETELRHLGHLLKSPKHPLVLIFGGGKSHDKIPVMSSFEKSADYFLVGGGVANTFLKVQGFNIGDSQADETPSPKVKQFIKDDRVILPVDYIQSGKKILDIGPLSVTHFAAIIAEARTVIWNGPFGLIEKTRYSKGSLGVARAIAKNKKAFSLAGGGETVMFLKDKKLDTKFSFISTGGGAMLEFLAGKKLPGIEALKSSRK
ncbi:MAG: phosphoglycerate kinase [Anaplasmataceae bacterium]|nr:phosphoglycerate kinase [Anaplasmataceae bacterium]